MTTTTTETNGHGKKKAPGVDAAGAKFIVPIEVPIKQVHESPFNRRQHWGNMEELAQSIRSVGLLEDLLARPHPTKDGDVELVFGHRRLRGSKLAELAVVPVRVRPMTDEQVIEAQAVENLQREDIHPLEEAETFKLLLDQGRMTADDVATRIGRGKSYVYARLKLLDLDEAVREAWLAEKILDTVALCIARIPDRTLQKAALKRVTEYRRDEGPMPAARAREIIIHDYMLRLADAPWKLGDATLVAAAGSCNDCPKRTKNQRELFADVGKADMCTDPICYGDKRKAHLAIETEKLEAAGVHVVDAVKRSEYAGATPPNGYTDLANTNYNVPSKSKLWGKTNGAVLKAAKVDRERVVMFDEGGKLVELVSEGLLAKATKALGGDARTRANPDRQHRLQRELDGRILVAVSAAVVDRAEREQLDDKHMRFLCKRMSAYGEDGVAKRRGWDLGKGKNPFESGKRFAAEIDKLRGAELRGLLMELVVVATPYRATDICALYGLDHGAIAKKIKAAVKAERAARKAAKKGGAK